MQKTIKKEKNIILIYAEVSWIFLAMAKYLLKYKIINSEKGKQNMASFLYVFQESLVFMVVMESTYEMSLL